MAAHLQQIHDRRLTNIPSTVRANIVLEVMGGSQSYGTSRDHSDWDIIDIYMPPKHEMFPHLNGYIHGWDAIPKKPVGLEFKGIIDDAKRRSYDFKAYSLPHYLDLVTNCNPNMVEILFTAQDCLLHQNKIGLKLREHRHLFLAKKCFDRFCGYAFQQISRLHNRKEGRRELIEKYGFDVKFLAHAIRLLLFAEQIAKGDLDLRANSGFISGVLEGRMTLEEGSRWIKDREAELRSLYSKCDLPNTPDREKIRRLLVECIEEHYGNLGEDLIEPDKYSRAVTEIRNILDRL